MRLGTVIGRVTLSKTIPALVGARWLVVSPFSREQFQHCSGASSEPRSCAQERGRSDQAPLQGLSKEPSLVVFDDLGGGVGQTIGFIEGREAASPFEQPTPIDAIAAALVDNVFYKPYPA